MGLAEWSIASDAPRSWTRVMQPHQRWRKSTISTGKAWLTGTRAPCAPMLGNSSDICKDDVRRPSVDGLKGQVTPTGRAGWTPLRRHFHPSSTGRGFSLRSQKRYRLKALKMLYKRLSDGIFARSRPGALGPSANPNPLRGDQGGKGVLRHGFAGQLRALRARCCCFRVLLFAFKILLLLLCMYSVYLSLFLFLFVFLYSCAFRVVS